MAEAYVGEIRMFGGNFAPAGWAFCDGSLLPISGNETLFNLIGTTYGGDGQNTFALPDLRSRMPVHQGTGPGLTPRILAEAGGLEEVTLTVSQIPAHGIPTSDAVRSRNRPVLGTRLATGGAYVPAAQANTSQAVVGGGQPHENMPPYLVVNFIISLFGIFPSQS